jgi:hypothetical protein
MLIKLYVVGGDCTSGVWEKNCVIWFLSFVEEISYWFGEWIHMLLWLCSVTLAIVHHMCKWVNWFVFVFSLFNFLFDRFPMLIILFDWFSSYLVFCSFDWLFLSFYLFSNLVSLPSINSSFNCSSLQFGCFSLMISLMSE